jgi:hypothetical protein
MGGTFRGVAVIMNVTDKALNRQPTDNRRGSGILSS